MPTYQLKNSTVEAYRLEDTHDSQHHLINWGQGAITFGRYANWLLVSTKDGVVDCQPGQVVLWKHHKGMDGFEVIDHDAFLEKYEAD